MQKISGGVAAPKGFTAGGIHCGVRGSSTKKDLAMIYSETPCTAAQIPYAMTVAGFSLAGYLAAGVTGSGWIGLGVGAILLAVFAVIMTGKALSR